MLDRAPQFFLASQRQDDPVYILPDPGSQDPWSEEPDTQGPRVFNPGTRVIRDVQGRDVITHPEDEEGETFQLTDDPSQGAFQAGPVLRPRAPRGRGRPPKPKPAAKPRGRPKKHGDAPSYDCEECGKSFTRSNRLRDHIQSKHQGIKGYPCHLCDVECQTADALSRHITTKHTKDVKNPKHKCSVPGCSFVHPNIALLQAHELRVHRDDPATPVTKTITCNICRGKFMTRGHMLRHKRLTDCAKMEKFSCRLAPCKTRCLSLVGLQNHIKKSSSRCGQCTHPASPSKRNLRPRPC